MTDDPIARSRTMRAVKDRNTTPELIVRRYLHSQGFRYRLHRRDLPGRPDIVFPGRRKAILCMGVSGMATPVHAAPGRLRQIRIIGARKLNEIANGTINTGRRWKGWDGVRS